MLSRSFFPNFGQGPFPKIAGKGPDLSFVRRYTKFGLKIFEIDFVIQI